MACGPPTKVLRAALWSPLVAIVVFWAELVLGLYADTALKGGETLPPFLAAAGHSLFFVLLFGAPLVYVGALVLGMPLWLLLRKLGRLTPRWVIAMASVAGAFAALAGWRIIFGDWDFSGIVAILGAVAAAVGGTAFTRLARFPTQASRPAA